MAFWGVMSSQRPEALEGNRDVPGTGDRRVQGPRDGPEELLEKAWGEAA